MKFAPVLIPTLCRAEKFKRCIESLKKNSWAKYTEVYIALDYPKKSEHWSGYNEICNYLNQIFSEFFKFHIIKRTCNYGAKRNVIDCRNKIFEKHECYIYADDDIEFSPNFLEYINKNLEYYEKDPNVIAVCGYSYPIKWVVSPGSTEFKSSTGCFMWGTGFWREKHKEIEALMLDEILKKEFEKKEFKKWGKKLTAARYTDLLTLATYEPNSLLNSMTDTGLSLFMELYDKCAIFPVISKTRNYGFDGSGQYCQNIKAESYRYDSFHYNYSAQPIDNAKEFCLHIDKLEADDENKSLWDKFEYRSPTKLKLKIGLCRILGEKNYNNLYRVSRIIKRSNHSLIS